jgi:hypothetical protein
LANEGCREHNTTMLPLILICVVVAA